WGSPHSDPVAAASTYSQRGVMTATPNEESLGLIKWTRELTHTSWKGPRSLTARTNQAQERAVSKERIGTIHGIGRRTTTDRCRGRESNPHAPYGAQD